MAGFPQPNHSAFLSISLSLTPDYGLQTSSQKYRMWENLSKRVNPECFQPLGRKKPFDVGIAVCLLSLLNFKTYQALAKLINMCIEPSSVLGIVPLMILCCGT